MRFALFCVFTLIAGYIGHQFLPWWSIAAMPAIMAFIFRIEVKVSFLGGFLMAALLWGGYAALIDLANDGILSARIGKLFGGVSGFILILLTGLVGGIFGGLGALTGSLGRSLIKEDI
ncbi:MAG: hypothetical protein ACK4TA_17685 [Saprospiraceae bacterium]